MIVLRNLALLFIFALIAWLVFNFVAPAPIGGAGKYKSVGMSGHKHLKNEVLLVRFLTVELVKRYEQQTGKRRIQDEVYNPLERFEWPWTADYLMGNAAKSTVYSSVGREGYLAFQKEGLFFLDKEARPARLDTFYFCPDGTMMTVDGQGIQFSFELPGVSDQVGVILFSDSLLRHEVGLQPIVTMPAGWQKKYAQYKVPPMPKEMLANILAFNAGQPLPFPNQGKAVNE